MAKTAASLKKKLLDKQYLESKKNQYEAALHVLDKECRRLAQKVKTEAKKNQGTRPGAPLQLYTELLTQAQFTHTQTANRLYMINRLLQLLPTDIPS